jgi:arylsulfatase A-like enzyme/Flp pilus assembly protein TadD
LIVVIVVGWFAWRRVPTPSIASASCRGCNVLLVTIDTLRLDRVGAFGGRPGLTPNIDRLAAEGLRLTRAYSSAPLTLPSHASILTGVSPPVHGLRANGLFRLGPNIPTLATMLKGAGYRTGAFVGAFVLDARFGLNRGFDVYDDRYGEKPSGDPAEGAERRAEEVVRPAAAWILNSRQSSAVSPSVDSRQSSVDGRQSSNQPSAISHQPWFAWVHLYDPHEPYRAPEPYASQHEPYDAEVAYTDATIGRLLDDLRAAHQLDHTLVMIAADHGESLGEHGERTHGVFVYDVTMRVPWIVWGSWLGAGGSRFGARGTASDALVRLIDLAPTVLDLVDVKTAAFEGRSVIPVVNGREPEPTRAYIEAMDANLTRNWAPLTGLVTRGYKLIDLPIPEMYDLTADRHETINLFQSNPAQARTLSALLRDTTLAFLARGTGAEKTALSADARQRLQALGYVAMSADPGRRSYSDADDPKSLIAVSNDLNQATSAFNAGSRQPAMASVRTIIVQHPGFTTAYGMYASMQRETGDLPGAIATLDGIVRRGIADQRVLVVLAGYFMESGDDRKAIDLLQTVVAAHPDEVEAYNSLGSAYSKIGRHEEARAAYRKVLELQPTSATAYENIGVDELRAGERDRAAADLARALELDPQLASAHNTLAALLAGQGHADQAVAHWKTALQLNPRLYDALYNLGVTLNDTGNHDEARPYLQRFVDVAPPVRYGREIAEFKKLLGK